MKYVTTIEGKEFEVEVVDDRHAQRAALDRLGARADLVEQDQRRRGELAIDRKSVV